MVANRTIARPYAKAAFEFAVAHGELQKWTEFMQFMAVVSSNPGVVGLLSNPKVTPKQALDLLSGLAGKDLDQSMHNFLQLLSEYHRLVDIPAVATLFDEYSKDAAKTVVVEVTSATAMTTKQKEQLLQALKIRLQREINANFNIDPSLMGGAIIRAGDFVIDGSVRAKLERMKQAIDA
jgi:F-type H+-transporting ATPase subunit delta